MDQIPVNDFLLNPEKNNKIVMRHDFETACYSLSNMGQKVFFEVLAKIDSFSPAKDQVIRLSPSELEKTGIGFARSNIYKHFASACEEIQTLSVHLYGEDEKHVYKASINLFRGLTTKFTKDDQENIIEAYFSVSPEAAPYFTELSKNMQFNQFLISQTRPMKKAASMRLYQWLRRHHWINIRRNETTVEIDLTELRAKLDYKNSYKNWRDFKARKLDPAIHEICQFSDLFCQYQPAKKGRGGKILSLIFYVRVKEDADNQSLSGQLLENNCPSLEPRLASMIRTQIPDMPDDLLTTLAVYDSAIIMESLLTFVRSDVQNKKINPVDYFVGILVNKARHLNETTQENSIDQCANINDISWADNLTLNF